MLKLILNFHEYARTGVAKGANFNALMQLPVRESIGRFKYIEEKDIDEAYEKIMEEMKTSISALTIGEDEDDD